MAGDAKEPSRLERALKELVAEAAAGWGEGSDADDLRAALETIIEKVCAEVPEEGNDNEQGRSQPRCT